MKKVAVIKLGSRIAFGGTSGGSGEALAIISMLVKGGADVTAFTKILAKDKEIPGCKVLDVKDNIDSITLDNYDSLVVLNGSVNYFGGAEDEHQTLNYKAMTNFSKSGGTINYIYCDPNLTLVETWPSVAKKEWGANYKQSEIELANTPIRYISQPKDTSIIESIKTKTKINVTEMVHYPFEKFPLLSDEKFDVPLSEKKYDLLYGGTFRGGKRQEDMIKFYFGHENATMFGNIKPTDFVEKKVIKEGFTLDDMPSFEKAVKYDDFNSKMAQAKATVIIGDKYYKQIDDLGQRTYEAIQAGIITFIDADYDKTKRVFTDERLRSFLYVKDGAEVKSKLDTISTWTDKQYKDFADLQRRDTSIDESYSTDFVNLLK